MTAEELIKLPSGRYRYELVKGELLTMSPAGVEHGVVIVNLTTALALHVKNNNLGIVCGAETGFTLERNPDTVLAPDISFIRMERAGIIAKGFHEGPPDLAVEVVSPKESRRKVETKTAQWLQFGARAVWLVNPQTRTVEIWSASREKRVLKEMDVLTGDEIVPSFAVAVSEIFVQN